MTDLPAIAADLRALARERGWTTAEALRELRRQLRPAPADASKAARDARYVATLYRDLVADKICVRCRVERATSGVRCEACRAEVNRARREQYRKSHEGTDQRRYKCSGCGEAGHTLPACSRRLAACGVAEGAGREAAAG